MHRIRVVLADGYALARDAIRSLLEKSADIEVVGEAADGREAVEVALAVRPDIVVMHASMPGMRNYAAVRALRRAGVPAGLIVLARHSTAEDECLAFETGADGYVAGDARGKDLLASVHAVHGGERAKRAPLRLDDAPLELDSAEAIERLSARERETLKLVVQGYSSAAIAERLALSPKSVETYRSRIMAKLGVSGMPALVKLAIQHGITTFN